MQWNCGRREKDIFCGTDELRTEKAHLGIKARTGVAHPQSERLLWRAQSAKVRGARCALHRRCDQDHCCAYNGLRYRLHKYLLQYDVIPTAGCHDQPVPRCFGPTANVLIGCAQRTAP